MTVEFFGVRGFSQIGGITKATRPDETQKSGKAEGTDGASFSAALQGAHGMQAAGTVEDTDRNTRIQALKEQITNGSYEPDLNKVASSLLKFLVEEG